MDNTTWLIPTLASAFIAVIGFFVYILKAQNEMDKTVATISVKVETIWDFTIRRAMAEATQHGLGEFHSPFKPNMEKMQGIFPSDLKHDIIITFFEKKWDH